MIDEIADMDHPARIVERIGVNRKARMGGGAKQLQGFAQRRIERNGDDVGARDHCVVDAHVVQAEHVFQQRAFMRRHIARRFLKPVFDVLAHRGRRKTKQPAQPVDEAQAWSIASAS